jgi:hypothetical protein
MSVERDPPLHYVPPLIVTAEAILLGLAIANIETLGLINRIAYDVSTLLAVPPRLLGTPDTSSCTATEVMLRERLYYRKG